MTIDPVSGAFSWTPTEAQGGLTPNVTVTVSDGTTTDSQSFTVTVNELNDAPVLNAIADRSVDEGSTLSLSGTVLRASTVTPRPSSIAEVIPVMSRLV